MSVRQFQKDSETEAGIEAYASLTDNFYVVGERPRFTINVRLGMELVCIQMILDKRIYIEISEPIVKLETPAQKIDLFNLVGLVQPGYFRSRTSALGDYFGIYKEDKLVAVAGERMKMNAYTEVSAIVTHPEHTGRDYAKQLVAHATNKIFNEVKTPYFAKVNTGVIRLYEKLGFVERRKMSFWNLVCI